MRKFHKVLKSGGWLIIADLDKEDGSFHTDGSTDAHLGFGCDELRRRVEAAGFTEAHFSNAYEIKKKIDDERRSFPIFLMTARKR